MRHDEAAPMGSGTMHEGLGGKCTLTRRHMLQETAAALMASYAGTAGADAKAGEVTGASAPARARVDARYGVVDVHTHPNMKSYMFKNRFWRAHNPPAGFFPLTMRVDLDALIEGGVKAFICATYVVERVMFDDVWPLGVLGKIHPRAHHIGTAPMDVLTREYLDEAERMVEEARKRRGDVIEIARSYKEMQRITGEGKVCMLHGVEGAHHLNGNIDMVDELFERGVCQMIVPHLYPNKAGGCVDSFTGGKNGRLGIFKLENQDDAGLSSWGAELVEKLLDVGIIVDPTHGTREYRKQVVEIAREHPKKRPVILSHLYVRKDGTVGRMGPTPEDVRDIAETGGVVGIMMGGRRRVEGVPHVLNTMDYLIKHGGEDVVAIGSDFDGFIPVPPDLRSPRGYVGLRQAMLKKFSEKQVEKFLNRNADRVLQAGWGA